MVENNGTTRVLGLITGAVIGFAIGTIIGVATDYTSTIFSRVGPLVGLGLFGVLLPNIFFFILNHLLGLIVGAFDGLTFGLLICLLLSFILGSSNTFDIDKWYAIIGGILGGIIGLIVPKIAYKAFLPALILWVILFKSQEKLNERRS